MSRRFNNKAFIREGEFYKSQRRIFSRWTKAIFWWLFPSLFLLFIVAWLIFLWGRSEAPFAYQIVGTLITGSILMSLGLYVLALLKQR